MDRIKTTKRERNSGPKDKKKEKKMKKLIVGL